MELINKCLDFGIPRADCFQIEGNAFEPLRLQSKPQPRAIDAQSNHLSDAELIDNGNRAAHVLFRGCLEHIGAYVIRFATNQQPF